jgi:SAM-dependent methyltransferase
MSDAQIPYSGTDNLEVMAEAVNYNRFLAKLLLDQAAVDDRILDFGAGIGTFTRMVREQGYRISGVEIDPALRYAIVGQGIPCAASLDELGDATADFIYSLNVMEHIEDDAAALRGLLRVLAPGGRLLLYVPAFTCLYSAMDRKVGHVRRYRKRALSLLLQRCGFTVSEARYIDSLGFLASLAYKVFGNDSGDIDRASLRLYDRFIFPASCALDRVASPFFGKNLLVLARRTEA